MLQIAPPATIYSDPADRARRPNSFGSPKNQPCSAGVVRRRGTRGRLSARARRWRSRTGNKWRAPPITLGIRPEAFQVSGTGVGAGKIMSGPCAARRASRLRPVSRILDMPGIDEAGESARLLAERGRRTFTLGENGSSYGPAGSAFCCSARTGHRLRPRKHQHYGG